MIEQKNIHKLFLFILIQGILALVFSALFAGFSLTAASIAAPIIAAFPICFFWLRSGIQHDTKSMTPKTFVLLFCFLFGVNMAAGILVNALMQLFSILGFPIRNIYNEIEPLFTSSPAMILFAVIIAPIVEEFVFRGCILGNLQRYGKSTALLMSALLFGIMHQNIHQALSTFFIGLVLGLIFMEYGLKYAILFHMLNNAAALVFTFAGSSDNNIITAVVSILVLALIIGAILYIFKNRTYLMEQIFYSGSQELHDALLTSAMVWGVIAFHLFIMLIVQLFTPIQ